MQDAEKRVTEIVDHLHYLFTEKRDLMHEKITYYREKASSTAMSLYAGISDHGRKMQDITAWVSDISSIAQAVAANPGASSFQDTFTRLQGATCDGTTPKPSVVSALTAQIANAGLPGSADFSSIVSPVLTCACSASWDMTGPEYVRLWTAFWIIVGGGTSPAQVDETVNALKPVVPLFMGTAGMCSEACQTAMRSLMTNIMSVARAALPEVTFPATATASYPVSSVGCMCGIDYAGMMNAVIPAGTSVSGLVNSLSEPFNAPYFDLLKRILTFLFGPGAMCGGQCPQAFEDGQVIGWTIGMHSAWPSLIQSQVSTASVSQLPSEAQVVEFSAHTVGCWCSINYATIVSKVQSYVVPISAFPPTGDGQPLNMIEDMLGTVMNGTSGSGGFCDTGACPAMVATMMNLFTNISIAVATNPFDNYVAFSNGILTHQRLEQITKYSPPCLCAYFEPDSTGDIFPLIRRKETEWRENGFPSEIGAAAAALFDVQRQAVRATKSCKSGACRIVFENVFEVVTAAAGSPGGDSCTVTTSATCTSSNCPLPTDGVSYAAGCDACTVATTRQPQLFPFGHLPNAIDAYTYWSTCAMSVECPAEGVRGYILSNTFTMAGSVDTFNLAQFKQNYAELLAPAGSTKEGSVTAADISATVSGGSVVVAAEVIIYNLIVKSEVETTMGSLTTAQASTAFGVAVTDITPLEVTEMSFPPPAPPPGPGTGFGGDQTGDGDAFPMWAIAVIIAAGVVALILLVVIIVVSICCCCKKKKKKETPVMQGIPMPGQLAADKI